ncbi:MAG TPA: hypothetical protein VIX89_01650 [Bryobacteraceae bacterium]
MFFRRVKPRELSFADYVARLKQFGFTPTNFPNSPLTILTRDGIGTTLEERPGEPPHVGKPGLIAGDEIALLVNGGYQMFWKTPSSRRVPALAPQLKALHNFQEDLKEVLGQPSLYNESLGTTSGLHLYDRVEHRDAGDSHKPWEAQPAKP